MPRNQVTSELKKVSKNALIYSFGNITSKAVSFLLIPVYTQFLSSYEVGVIVLLEVLEALYNSAAPLGMMNSLWRYFSIEQERNKERHLISSHYFFIMGFNVGFLLILMCGSTWVAEIYLSDNGYSSLIKWFFLAIFLGLSRVFILSLFRIYEKAIQFTALAIVDLLILVTLSVWFVVKLKLGIEGVIYAKLISSAIMFVVTAVYVTWRFGMRIEIGIMRRSIKYGFPLIFHGIALLILSLSDRVLIKEFLSVEKSGIYGISYKFGMIMNMVLVTPFIQAWQPVMFRLENKSNQREIYNRVALHFIQIATIAWLLVSVIAKYLVKIASPEEFHAGVIIIPWVAFAYLLYGLQNIFKAGALLGNETAKMSSYTSLSAGLNILLNIIMIPVWGIGGAALATVVSYLFMMALVYNLSQKCLHISWRWRKMLTILFLGCFFVIASLFDFKNIFQNLLKDSALLILLPLCMTSSKLVSLREIREFITEFRK